MLEAFASYSTYEFVRLNHGSRLADALNFFIYDTIKIFLLLAAIIFAVSVIRSYFPPEKTKRILSHKKEFIGNILAALLGVVTLGAPLFIGFVEAGVPLGVPLYSNAAGVIPIVYALMEKGMNMGAVLAFMMAVTARSLPEMIILRKVLKVPLPAVFAGVMTVTITAVGYLLNAIL